MKQSLIPVKVDARWVLLDATLVREIRGGEPWLPIPQARAELPGVMAWRGRAIPLVDLAYWFGRHRLELREVRPRTLVVAHDAGIVALPVDSVREVLTVTSNDLTPAHGSRAPYSQLELDLNGSLMPLVDLKAILNDLVESASHEGSDAAR
ncbi:MAG: chemotaxis protein CheW [Myxococcota bacterium]